MIKINVNGTRRLAEIAIDAVNRQLMGLHFPCEHILLCEMMFVSFDEFMDFVCC